MFPSFEYCPHQGFVRLPEDKQFEIGIICNLGSIREPNQGVEFPNRQIPFDQVLFHLFDFRILDVFHTGQQNSVEVGLVGEVVFASLVPKVKELVLQTGGGFDDDAGRNSRCRCASLDLSEIGARFPAARERIEKNSGCGSAAQFKPL